MEYGNKYLRLALTRGTGSIIEQEKKGNGFHTYTAGNGIMVRSFIRGNTWDGNSLGVLQRKRSQNAGSFSYAPEDEQRLIAAVEEYNTAQARRARRLYAIYEWRCKRVPDTGDVPYYKRLIAIGRECEHSTKETQRMLAVARSREQKERAKEPRLPLFVPGSPAPIFRYSPENEKEWALGFIDCISGGDVAGNTIVWHSPGIRNFLRGAIGNPINVREAQKVIEGDAPEDDKMKFLRFLDVLKRAVNVLENAAMEKEQTNQYRKAVGH